MVKVLCCVRNFDLVERWKTTIKEFEFVQVFAIEHLLNMPSGLVILDGAAPDIVDFAGRRDWARLVSRHRVLFGDPTPEAERGMAAMQTGCVGYCHLYTFSEQLKQILDVLDAGEMWVGRELMTRMLTALKPQWPQTSANEALLAQLSEREQEVVQLVINGLANKEIADRMAITVRTVKAHLTSIFAKLEVRDRLQLVAKLKR
ncbi:helix-turn-helix transcriptional regulator [Permianibacter aggregans]|uniref:DNA-binding NarL/FixJ family response regulator n=1 Tax=Permianibacter aggregans TaxID=1510150 RepID=A0A4R6UUR2_9GAMM|nr:response regulator transcription factor [Permianibacter aggregans]QGX39599.1 response regulator transcription factor [Permianibacter aggregans]TDQ49649.1 DNA-binding NarL/FixJ family response regulator [Permianibacter aggregans]